MSHLTEAMKTLIRNYNAASVATVNDDGTPAVSPKATFVIIDSSCIAFGNIRSPGTVKNIRSRPHVELNFIDVLTRRAVRIKGTAAIVEKDAAAAQALMPQFKALWESYLDSMDNFVRIDIQHAELILSPAYDIGLTADELAKTNMDKLSALI